MASPPPAGPAPPAVPRPDDDALDIDTRISLAEQRLVAREQRLGQQLRQLSQRAGQAAAPQALLARLAGVAGVAGVALAGAGLVWAMRRGGSRGPAAHTPAAAHAGGLPQLLLGLLPMAWPLLPARWRSRVSPATAAAVLGVVAPLLQRLLARQPAAPDAGPPTVPRLDLLRYAGTWHEQARLPAPFEAACSGQPRATYTPIGLGGRVAVHNECRSANGRLRVADGVARVVPGSGGARLQLSFLPAWLQWLPFDIGWADLWVLHVDEAAADYRVAIAGHPSRRGLWLLSRSPQLPADELQRLVARASALGYDTSRLVLAAGPPVARAPG